MPVRSKPADAVPTGGAAQKIMRLVSDYKKFKEEVAKLEENKKLKTKKRDSAELKLYEYLEDNGLRVAKLGDGTSVSRKETTLASCNVEHFDRLVVFMKDRHLDKDCLRAALNKTLLNKVVNELIDEGEEVPEFIEFHIKKGVTIRG